MIAAPQSGVSKREFLIFLYKYRARLISAFIIPLALFFAVSFIPTPLYKASSVLIVRLGSEYIYQPELGNAASNPTPAIPFNQEQTFKSEVAILGSDDLHAQVIETIGLDTLFPRLANAAETRPERLAEAVEIFDKSLDIFLEKESAVIDVSFEHTDRALAMKVLGTLLTQYFEKRKQLYLDPRVQLAEKELEARRKLALEADHALEDYKRTHNIYSLETQRTELLDQRSEALKQSVNISSAGLENKIAAYTHQLDQLDAEERELARLEKEAQIAEDSYSAYAHKLDEAKAYENLQHARAGCVRVIQPPTAPPSPKRLQPLIILSGIFVSVLCTLIVAATTEFFRSGFLTPEQIERSLGLPVLAVLPFHPPSQRP